MKSILTPGLLLAAALLPSAAIAAPAAKPNVIVIVADDLGYGEIRCRGAQEIPTPHIQSIARAGICFTDAYVSCPVCSPTRAGLITGRYQQRFGHEFNTGPPRRASENVGLPLDQVTMAERLKKLGYATGIVGKWHLGFAPHFHPQQRGFDEFYGFLGGAHSYLDSQADPTHLILRGNDPVDEPEYLTDALGREAVAFIDRHLDEPFFLYLPFNATHGPLEATDKYAERFTRIEDPKRRTFAAMLAAMDDAVGAVLVKLREEKLEQNTLLFFIGDNGGPTAQMTSKNDPLRGFKGQVWEGGIRVPCVAQWPAQLPAGEIYAQPIIALDILPTVLAAAGETPPADGSIDGVDLLPYLKGEANKPPHEALYWRYGQQWAIRKGDLKLLHAADGGVQLFDLASDISERHNLAAQQPQTVAELTRDYQAWNSELAEPRWFQRGRAEKVEEGKPASRRERRQKANADGT